MEDNMNIPKGVFCADSTHNDLALKKKMEELKKKLLQGEKVKIGKNGEVDSKKEDNNQIYIPPGKLAVNLYWYERNAALLDKEKEIMRVFFPNFKLSPFNERLEDGRIYWTGTIFTGLGKNSWHLMIVYSNNHPNNDSYGGSIRVYSIEPDLNEYVTKFGSIPHLLRDENENYYLCTARKEDFTTNTEGIGLISAASTLAWAVKWIAVYEMWVGNVISKSEFEGHNNY
jgi:hypothetical protein